MIWICEYLLFQTAYNAFVPLALSYELQNLKMDAPQEGGSF
jgi:hypothetical protein